MRKDEEEEKKRHMTNKQAFQCPPFNLDLNRKIVSSGCQSLFFLFSFPVDNCRASKLRKIFLEILVESDIIITTPGE
jgi:hypothetical protein